jgi:hypothetical protein
MVLPWKGLLQLIYEMLNSPFGNGSNTVSLIDCYRVDEP